MERISRNNYEVYFLDYHEGRLGNEEKQMVMAFLEHNPDLYDEFNDFQSIVLTAPEIRFPGKTELFRTEVSVPEANEWEYLCIAYMEGDLSAEEARRFESECGSDPEKGRVLELYMATRLAKDESVVFSDKQSLKKKALVIPAWAYRAAAAAAVVALGWIIFSPFSEKPMETQVAVDSTREIIYIDKLSHPSKFEKVASNEALPELKAPKSVTGTENVSAFEQILTRDIIALEPLKAASAGKVLLSGGEAPSPNELFAYRYIPDPEEDEYQTLLAFTGDFLRKNLLGQDPEMVKKSKFTFWELADAGLEKVSGLFGTRADIERQYSESGELMEVTFESSLVAFNTPVRRRAAAQVD